MAKYPTLMFFKSGANSNVTHRGETDWDSLVDFVGVQMLGSTTKIEVRNYSYLA